MARWGQAASKYSDSQILSTLREVCRLNHLDLTPHPAITVVPISSHRFYFEGVGLPCFFPPLHNALLFGKCCCGFIRKCEKTPPDGMKNRDRDSKVGCNMCLIRFYLLWSVSLLPSPSLFCIFSDPPPKRITSRFIGRLPVL